MKLKHLYLKTCFLSLLYLFSMAAVGGCRASCDADSDVEDAVEDVADEVEDAVD